MPGGAGRAGGRPPAVEHHLEVTRTARYYTLGTPSRENSEVWFVLHGFGQLAGYFIRNFAVLDDGRRLVVAPEALSRFYLDRVDGRTGHESRVGATWMTREDRLVEIADYVAYLDALYEDVFRTADRSKAAAVVLGFSQGAEAAGRWVCRGRSTLNHLVLWAGKLAPELDTDGDFERMRSLRLSVVLGHDDPFGDQQMLGALEGRLVSRAVPYQLIRFGGGHELDAPTLAALAG